MNRTKADKEEDATSTKAREQFNSLPVNEIFSLMNYLDFIYNQTLPGIIQKSKDDFSFVINDYFKKYAENMNDEKLENLLERLNTACNSGISAPNNTYKVIRQYKIKKWFGKKDLYPLFIKELTYLQKIELKNWSKKNSHKKSDIAKLINLSANNEKLYEKELRKIEKGKEFFVSHFNEYEISAAHYSNLIKFDIAVCATMSAGKSTLVNALLGNDILPARNEATTAKITSVYDKDNLKKVIGFTSSIEGEQNFAFNADVSLLNKWNSSNEVNHIFLQSDLDGIKNTDKYAVAIHDTPGTNNSTDLKHQEITMNFLQQENINALIYVANFEQMLTTDENFLLKEIASKVIKDRNIPVIFVINKVDSYDKQKESFTDTVNPFVQNLINLGFEGFSVVPVAAKPARLLKMALRGRQNEFTESESDIFEAIINKFTKRMNINEFCEHPVSYERVESYGNEKTGEIKVDDVSYDVETIRKALVNTGLPNLEKIIEDSITQK